MGATPRFEHPNIWSPAGGYWANPAAWKRNTAIAFVSMAALSLSVFVMSVGKERREQRPLHSLVFGGAAKNLNYVGKSDQ
ncbi:mitochondrial Complex I (CI) NADH:ubiquinone oxidoreductase subunit NUUM [Andalucia godoyi]|uniref:Mitochondrial Complex I (CI) NADH:ubiquinone oxidoreductase subunit NUUM n=1 Tax=Andalucia godoyi TaxID=505711 RepID=A0A8K0AIS7_ANDGO|nr:mitochondrial Complex I (CI) NADH:ubiquinone oxidoreductase subunit NUUM [Andalucia godoyi]|eukprot:ANDGO_02540.mRNA.1 mitochondrial Complex I (CI) NADH:ubiquinone oxidoreductase subunit NUUM